MEAINKAFEILDVFLKNDRPFSIYEIAKITGFKTSTAYRVTNILIKRGYVYQQNKRGKYLLSTKKLIEFAGLVKGRLNVRNVAMPYLHELSKTADESAALALCLGNSAFDSDIVSTTHRWNIRSDIANFGLYSTSTGKTFLAHRTEKDLKEYFDSIQLIPKTSNTIIDEDEIRLQLKKIRQEGVAFDYEEHELGLLGVASPIWDSDDNVIAAISILAPTLRVNRHKLIELAPLVKQYAYEISKAMGHIMGHI
jgi:IclR family transcriptional regulator, KDG regulon repressor